MLGIDSRCLVMSRGCGGLPCLLRVLRVGESGACCTGS